MAEVELSPRYERFVRDQLESGRFGSASEVLEEALQLMELRDAEVDALVREWSPDELRAKVQEALDDPSPSIPAEEVFRRLEEKHARLRSRGG